MHRIVYGYVRVSTKEQNLDRQMIAMRERGIAEEHIFIDKQSGKDFDRPAYQQMMNVLSEGDTLVIKKLQHITRKRLNVVI